MAVLGRLLGTLGWLWFGAGIVAPMFDFGRVNVFPGLILIFVGRLIRAQARRRETEETPEPAAPEQEARPLNTERSQPAEPAAEPVVRTPPILVTPAPPPPVVTKAEETEDAITEKLFSKIGPAGPAPPDDEATPDPHVTVEDGAETKTLSSEEMIARARQRWDRRR